jgi:hypothetical protein
MRKLLLLFCCVTLSLFAAPSKVSISTAYPKWLGGMQVANESYCEIEVRFVNKTKVEQMVILELFDTRYPLTMWQYKLTLPSRAYSTRRFPVKLDSGIKQLKLKLYNDEKGSKGDLLSEMNSGLRNLGRNNLAVLSHSLEKDTISVTNFKRTGWNVTNLLVLPSHWSELRKLNMLILHAMDREMINEETIAYLRTYVENGGTVLFNHADALEAVYELGAYDLLPVNYLGMKQVHSLKLLDDKPLHFAQGINFIDSELKEGSIAIFTQNKAPIFVSRRVGLGQSLFFAAPLDQGALVNDYQYKLFYSYLLKYAGGFFLPSEAENGAAEEVSSEMNGIEVPGTGVILWFTIIYSIAIAMVFIFGSVAKKKVRSWQFAVGLSLVTLVILLAMRSKVMNVERENISASFSYKSMVNKSISEELISTYFTKDTVMDYKRRAEASRMGNVTAIRKVQDSPPEINPETGESKTGSSGDDAAVLSTNFITIINDVSDIQTGGMPLQQGQSRSLVISNPVQEAKMETVKVKLGSEGIEAMGVKHDKSLLVGINGGQMITGDEEEDSALLRVFSTRSRLIPYYINVKSSDDEKMELQSFPVELQLEKGSLVIPQNLLAIDFAQTNTIMKNPYSWQNQVLPQMSYRFSLRVPPALQTIKAQEIEFFIDLQELLPEIELTCMLEGQKPVTLMPQGGILKIPKKLQNKSLAELNFRLLAKRKGTSSLQTGQITGSRWKLESFKLEVRGVVP